MIVTSVRVVPSNYYTRLIRFKTVNPPTLLKHHFRKSILKFDEGIYLQKRCICLSSVRLEDSSKVESTVKAIKEQEKEEQKKTIDVKHKSNVATPEVKRSLGKKIWDELVHYYHGFRLLFIDIMISSRLVWKLMKRQELTRRENEQLVRTVADLFRLVPFSVFIIVPFMELLLPVFIRIFPGLLPSTFQTASDKESKIKKQLKLKLDMAKFLQHTLDEMSLESKEETHSEKAKEFAEFFRKIRKSGEQATNEDILKFAKIFEDEITLDSLSRPQLIALCRLIELQPIGTNAFLRFQLKRRLKTLKSDDEMIEKEGISNLTVTELQQACRSRGMRALGVPESRLRSQLQQWLELSLNEQIPPSLLLLSRVLYLPENIQATDQLKATLQALPEQAATEVKYRIGETEGKVDNKTKIELIKQEEEAIRKEIEEEEAIRREKRIILETEQEPEVTRPSFELSNAERTEHEAAHERLDLFEKSFEEVSKASEKMFIEKEELQDLKQEMQDYAEDMNEFMQLNKKEMEESKAAIRLRKRVEKMISKMDRLMDALETRQSQKDKTKSA